MNAEAATVSRQHDGAISTIQEFSNPSAFWGTGIEAVIEKAYRECFKTYILNGMIMTLRVPFAQNNERAAVAGSDLIIVGDGKAGPQFIWDQIDDILASDDFAAYEKILKDKREKVLIFDLPEKQWSVSRDLFDIARMKTGFYRPLPHKPYVFSSGNNYAAADVYNYLYCIGRIGMDCSGFVWYILSRAAQAGGIDLERRLDRLLPPARAVNPAFYVGTSFFNSKSAEFLQIEDKIHNLRPGDVMLFRDKDGTMAHSAVIQSVDLETGIVRYFQCTDEAPYKERGVHESVIRFDPEKKELSLKDKSLLWSQARFPPFPGETPSAYSTDGERYRAFPEFGAGKIVRLRAIAEIVGRIRLAEDR